MCKESLNCQTAKTAGLTRGVPVTSFVLTPVVTKLRILDSTVDLLLPTGTLKCDVIKHGQCEGENEYNYSL